MEHSEYERRLKEIDAAAYAEKKKLYYEFGMSKAKFKVGDIIKDFRWALLIDKIEVHKVLGDPEPVYSGIELKKDLTPRKDKNRVEIHGNHNVELVKSATT